MNYKYKWHPVYYKKTNSYYICASQYKGMVDGNPKYKTLHFQKYILQDENKYVDHINHNTLDNRRSNLRITENNKNLTNRKSKNSNNTSGYRNVHWNGQMNKWMVQLMVNGKRTKFGYFNDPHEAGKLAEELRQKYYGEFAGKS